MRRFLPSLGRVALTCVAVAIAVVVGAQLWAYYMDAPWTRDGRVRADVVDVAPDVSGLVSEVSARDNQAVHKGDVVFRIDQARFTLAVQQAEAVAAARRATLQEAMREAARYGSLSNVEVSQQQQQKAQATSQEAAAAYQQALVDLDVARLNLQRSVVTAPVDGTISNFDLRPGDYVAAGHPVAALVDSGSFYVDGYFEETKLPSIQIGDPVQVHLMGEPVPLKGHVQSIAAGIVDRERSQGSNLLADVNPAFSWVRLAQRIPVRVALDDVPPQVRLIAGRTATVRVLPRAGERHVAAGGG